MKTAFPQYKGTTKIRLYSNIPFDNTYEHHSMISRAFKDDGDDLYSASDSTYGLPKERFINRRRNTTGFPYYYPRYDIAGEYNFDYSNGLIASVVLELTPEQTNANYMRVESHDTNNSEYYYYFITGIQQINVDTYKLSLELDVLMTYQDEMLDGLVNIPVSTRRKHCHRYNSDGFPHCADFKNSEDAFVGVKPSIVTSKTELKLKGGMELLSGISWLYIAYEVESDLSGYLTRPYSFKGCKHPVCIFCQPYNGAVALNSTNPVNQSTLSTDILKLIEEGKVHGAKILPFPPFYDEDATVTLDSNGLYHISSPHLTWHPYGEGEPNPHWEWSLDDGKTFIGMYPSGTGHDQPPGWNDVNKNTLIVFSQGKCKYKHKSIALNGIESRNPSVTSLRELDPRLWFSPFRKYTICSPYATDYEFFPELIYAEHYYGDYLFYFESSATAYIGDNNIITYLSDETYYKYYKDINIGLSSSLNYYIPSGTNALDVFNATQAQSFYQSKIATGVTSGLTIAGGIGSIALGVAGFVSGAFTGGSTAIAGAGLIGGGVGAIASGTASAVNNAKSVNAKIEDLKNTPDSFNVQGGNYTSDYARTSGNMPYVVTYDCGTVVKNSANDFFYNYGYAVARDCYFNKELTFDGDADITDDNLFGRSIFNFIQLNEDITNKINNDIPHIIKQKISAIFNKGITIWNFFRNQSLWGTNQVSSTNNPDKWFMKHDLENAEFDY